MRAGSVIAAGRPPVVEAENLGVTYAARSGQPAVAALQGLSFSVQAGEFVAIIGRSGAGKTTLLRCLTGFVRPSAGRLLVNGLDVTTARARQLYRLRREVATVSQQLNLVERASALDNVLVGRLGYVGTLPSLLGWLPSRERRLAYASLAELGLAERALQRTDRLSGGERQRVAIARALVQRPRFVLADEPAASLDVSLTRFVLETVQSLNREQGVTVLVNLHDLDLARTYAARVLALRRGRLVFDGTRSRRKSTMALIRERPWEPGSDGVPGELPKPPLSHHVKLFLVVAALGAAHVWAWRGVEMDLGLIRDSLPHMADFLARMVPPEWSVVQTVTGAVLETLQIAIIGTTTGVVLALPLGFLAAGNVAHPLVRGVVRTLLNGIRSVPLICAASSTAGWRP